MSLDPSRLTELALQHAQLKSLYQAEASNPHFKCEADNPLIRAEATPTYRCSTPYPDYMMLGLNPALIPQPAITKPCGTPVQHVLAYTQRDYNELCQLIESDLFDALPNAEQGRLQRQKLIMIEMLAVLNERVADYPV